MYFPFFRFENLNSPFEPAVVPLKVFPRETFAPLSASPFSSFTVPVSDSCAKVMTANSCNAKNKLIRFISNYLKWLKY